MATELQNRHADELQADENLSEGRAPIMEHLRALGLNDRESQIYLGVAEAGKVPPSSLARRLRIPRSSVYLTLEGLAEKGLVSIHRSKSGMYYTANNSATILRLIEREVEVVNQKRRAATHVASFVETLFNAKLKQSDRNPHAVRVPKIQYFKGKKNVENMLMDNLSSWRASYTGAEDSGLWGFQDHSFVRHYSRYLQYRWESSLPGETIRLFTNLSPEEDSLRDRIPNRQVRALPIGIHFQTSVWIYGNYLILIQSNEEPHYAYQLEDPAICSNLRSVFQLLWNTSSLQSAIEIERV
jgi:sugar-specific transcriptional regulator TrmB